MAAAVVSAPRAGSAGMWLPSCERHRACAALDVSRETRCGWQAVKRDQMPVTAWVPARTLGLEWGLVVGRARVLGRVRVLGRALVLEHRGPPSLGRRGNGRGRCRTCVRGVGALGGEPRDLVDGHSAVGAAEARCPPARRWPPRQRYRRAGLGGTVSLAHTDDQLRAARPDAPGDRGFVPRRSAALPRSRLRLARGPGGRHCSEGGEARLGLSVAAYRA